MLYIIQAIIIFMLSLIVHIGVFRLFRKLKNEASVSLIIFFTGFIIASAVIFRSYSQNMAERVGLWITPLLWTAVVFYFLLALSYIIFFLYSFLVEESPTSTILGLLRKKRKVSEKEIFANFSNAKLIETRLTELIGRNIIRKDKKLLRVSKKGEVIAGVFKYYREILGWKNFG